MGDPVPLEEKRRRYRVLDAQHERISNEINAGLLGTETEVLFEEMQRGKWRGRTRTNKLVFVESPRNLAGKTLPVWITRTGAWSMQADIVPVRELSSAGV